MIEEGKYQTYVVGVFAPVYTSLFWRDLLAEFLGTFMLVFISIASGFQWTEDEEPVNTTHAALLTGLMVAFIVVSLGHVSGACINPVVSISFVLDKRLTVFRCICYIIVECAGAIVGALMLKLFTPQDVYERANLGVLSINPQISLAQGFGMEFLLGFFLMFGITAMLDNGRCDVAGSVPLAIGFLVTVNIYFGIRYTGAGFNPARALGPALVTGQWKDQWLYWAAPILGGASGTIIYRGIFSKAASFQHFKSFFQCCMRRDVGNDKPPIANGTDIDIDMDKPQKDKNRNKRECMTLEPAKECLLADWNGDGDRECIVLGQTDARQCTLSEALMHTPNVLGD